MKQAEIKRYCVCCGDEVSESLAPNPKKIYCSPCAIHDKRILQRVSALNRMIKDLRIKLYGQERGNERVRDKIFVPPNKEDKI